jgi:hypothetical protein
VPAASNLRALSSVGRCAGWPGLSGDLSQPSGTTQSLGVAACDDSAETERTAAVGVEHLSFFASRRTTVAVACFIPLQPVSPPVGQSISDLDGDQAGLLPVPPPPGGTVPGAEVPHPVGLEVWRRKRLVHLDKAGLNDADLTAAFHEARIVAEIEVVGTEVVVGADADERVEEILGEGQGMRFREDRVDLAFYASLGHATQVLVGLDPQIGRPHLNTELFGQEDRAQNGATSHVEHPHAGLERHEIGQGLRLPPGFGPILPSTIHRAEYPADRG